MSIKDFDFSQYRDPYHDRVMELVQSKVKGQAIKAPEKEEEPAAINFMEALKKSLAKTRGEGQLRRSMAGITPRKSMAGIAGIGKRVRNRQ